MAKRRPTVQIENLDTGEITKIDAVATEAMRQALIAKARDMMKYTSPHDRGIGQRVRSTAQVLLYVAAVIEQGE